MVLQRTQFNPVGLVRWAARITSVLAVGIIALFATSGGNTPTLAEWIAIAFFPVGLVIGLIVAWKREIPGAVIALASLVIFYAYMFATSSFRADMRYAGNFALFAIPAVLFLAAGLLARRES
ncbi:MAG TPA: hypothetical protein VK157_12055 [Phycisphaerales bacterium]|nr:hypothetical protein [Phycisphaerales bacterium]